MTEFERLVAGELHAALVRAGWKQYPTAALAVDLAPGVAAACDEASRNTESVDTARAAALTALRHVWLASVDRGVGA